MIPRIIHYCWFGGNPKPKLAKKCIRSWKRKCKEFQFIEWNEENFDIAAAPLYVRQAYEAKKWAFVTDYVRLWAMVNYGGVYMDTDVEVIRPLEPFLKYRAFSGFEDGINIPTGIMACEKGFPLFNEFLHYYDDASFYNENGEISCVTNVTIITNTCLKKGLKQNNERQSIQGFELFPKDYFCPLSFGSYDLKKTENTVTIHWFAGSWTDNRTKEKRQQRLKQNKRYEIKDKIIHFPNRVIQRLLGDSQYDKLKQRLKK